MGRTGRLFRKRTATKTTHKISRALCAWTRQHTLEQLKSQNHSYLPLLSRGNFCSESNPNFFPVSLSATTNLSQRISVTRFSLSSFHFSFSSVWILD
ncbi:hypothetical protein L6452_39221 [Arctium lappa]|uniref:Uncharacterized protein n=1 Tax=Arctium lappa TaxID=4217 RepID=A0ACB8XS52_ARCLA|nr:hypothetical protein L6452_39221 [Arctium lappa]